MKTIREMLSEYQTEVALKDLTPIRAAEVLVELSALTGNITEAIKNAELAYNRILLSYLESEEKANRAKIRAECSPEYLARQDARNALRLADEMIRSLKYLCRAQEKEWMHSSNL